MDCNVGGHFGPLLKFAGFDALEVRGKAAEFVLLVIDGDAHRVTIETAPHEALNSYDVAEPAAPHVRRARPTSCRASRWSRRAGARSTR